MAILLKADNRTLVKAMPYTYLNINYASGVTSVVVGNTDGFSDSDYILIGEIGHEHTEVIKITTVTASTSTLTIPATRFAHSESTKITRIPYNQVRFFWTTGTSFNTSNPVAAYADITPDQWYSQVEDSSNFYGYGWFQFKNETTGTESAYSNPIPYANFARKTVKSILDGFFSSLNNNDLQLVSLDDAMEWMNEAHDDVRAELDMAVDEVNVSDGTDSISLVSGTKEYSLKADFGSMITVFFDNNGRVIEPMSISDVDAARSTYYGTSDMRYYIRGTVIGFAPTPTKAEIVLYRYMPVPEDLVSYSDNINLPIKGFNVLKDFMLYRAKEKLRHSDALNYLEIYQSKVDKLVMRVKNRDNSIDSWSIGRSSSV